MVRNTSTADGANPASGDGDSSSLSKDAGEKHISSTAPESSREGRDPSIGTEDKLAPISDDEMDDAPLSGAATAVESQLEKNPAGPNVPTEKEKVDENAQQEVGRVSDEESANAESRLREAQEQIVALNMELEKSKEKYENLTARLEQAKELYSTAVIDLEEANEQRRKAEAKLKAKQDSVKELFTQKENLEESFEKIQAKCRTHEANRQTAVEEAQRLSVQLDDATQAAAAAEAKLKRSEELLADANSKLAAMEKDLAETKEELRTSKEESKAVVDTQAKEELAAKELEWATERTELLAHNSDLKRDLEIAETRATGAEQLLGKCTLELQKEGACVAKQQAFLKTLFDAIANQQRELRDPISSSATVDSGDILSTPLYSASANEKKTEAPPAGKTDASPNSAQSGTNSSNVTVIAHAQQEPSTAVLSPPPSAPDLSSPTAAASQPGPTDNSVTTATPDCTNLQRPDLAPPNGSNAVIPPASPVPTASTKRTGAPVNSPVPPKAAKDDAFDNGSVPLEVLEQLQRNEYPKGLIRGGTSIADRARLCAQLPKIPSDLKFKIQESRVYVICKVVGCPKILVESYKWLRHYDFHVWPYLCQGEQASLFLQRERWKCPQPRCEFDTFAELDFEEGFLLTVQMDNGSIVRFCPYCARKAVTCEDAIQNIVELERAEQQRLKSAVFNCRQYLTTKNLSCSCGGCFVKLLTYHYFYA